MVRRSGSATAHSIVHAHQGVQAQNDVTHKVRCGTIGNVLSSFWERLERLQKKHGLSDKRMADLAGRHRNTYLAARKRRSDIHVSFLDAVARELDVNVHYLLTGLGEPDSYGQGRTLEERRASKKKRAAQLAAEAGVSDRAVRVVLREQPDEDRTVNEWLRRMEDEERRLLLAEEKKRPEPRTSPPQR